MPIIWRGSCKVWPRIRNGVRWVIGNGNLIRFWEDLWLGDDKPLLEKAINIIPESIGQAKVCDLVDGTSNWNQEAL